MRNPSMKITVPGETKFAIAEQAKELGFHTGESLAAVMLKSLADIPANRLFEALAAARRAGERPIRPPVSPR